MNEGTNKVRLLMSYLSLLQLRGKTITDRELRKENDNFISSLKQSVNIIDNDLLEFLYCYTFLNFDALLSSTLDLNSNGSSVKIDKVERRGPEEKYQRDIIEVIDDKAMPIKRTSERVNVVELNDKEFDTTISNVISFYNSKAVEMIKMFSKEERTNIYGIPLNDLFAKAGLVLQDRLLFRNEDNISLINELSKNEDDKYGINKYYADQKAIFEINPKQKIDSNSNYQTSDIHIDYNMPSLVRDYLESLPKKPIEEKVNDSKIDNSVLDENILKMIMKIESTNEELETRSNRGNQI